MSSIYDALQRIQEQKDLISSRTAGDNSYRHSRIFWIIVLAVVISSVSTAGIFYGIRLMKGDNEAVVNAAVTKESPGRYKAVSGTGSNEEMNVKVDAGVEKKPDIEDIKVMPDSIDEYMKLGGRYYESGEYDRAMLTYSKALENHPGDARLLNNMGSVMLAKGEREKAVEYFTQAYEISGDFVEPVYNMACAYAIIGEKTKALLSLKKAIKLNPLVKQWVSEDPDLRNLEGIAEFEVIIREQ